MKHEIDYQTATQQLDAVLAKIRLAGVEFEHRVAYAEKETDTTEIEKNVDRLIRSAYISLVTFLNLYQLNDVESYLRDGWNAAQDNLLKAETSPLHGPFLPSLEMLEEVTRSVAEVIGRADGTDGAPPAITVLMKGIPLAAHRLDLDYNTHEKLEKVAEAILLPQFPDYNANPVVNLPEGSRQPDGAIPSRSTLLEYKWISTKEQVREIIDEMQADVRTYASDSWQHVVFVVGQANPYTTQEKLEGTINQGPSGFKPIPVVLLPS